MATINKYRNRWTVVDGIKFQSQKEATRYSELKILEQAGVITKLELQPKYPLVVNGQQVGTYTADFRYVCRKLDMEIVEDVKSEATKTPIYRLKKRLMWALYGVQIVEV